MEPDEIIQLYMQKMKFVQINILEYLENEEAQREDFEKLIIFLDNQEIRENKYELKMLLYLLSNIGDYHYRFPSMYTKIEQIISNYKKEITKGISKTDIFKIFNKNKLMLLFLFEEDLITPDEKIAFLFTTDEYKMNFYPHYFLKEFKSFFDEKFIKKINSETNKIFEHKEISEKTPEAFERNRKNGVNEDILCQLIRNDSLQQFKSYLKRMHMPQSCVIKLSIFESNPFLSAKKVSLIEYAAFHGSIEIFKYLKENQIELTPNLWIFAVHSQNIKLIQFLEENDVKPPNNSFDDCLVEAIKCHHFDMTKYIVKNLLKNNVNNDTFCDICIRYYNFINFTDLIDDDLDVFDVFYDFCEYDYSNIVDYLSKIQEFDVSEKRIKKTYIFSFNS